MYIELIIFVCFFIMSGVYSFYMMKMLTKLKTIQEKHHRFLIGVRNTIPVIEHRIEDLENQIVMPDENKLH